MLKRGKSFGWLVLMLWYVLFGIENHYKIKSCQVMNILCFNKTQLSLSSKIRVLKDTKHYHKNIKVYGLWCFGHMDYNDVLDIYHNDVLDIDDDLIEMTLNTSNGKISSLMKIMWTSCCLAIKQCCNTY